MAGKITAGLAESNGSLPPGFMINISCEMTAYRMGPAPSLMLELRVCEYLYLQVYRTLFLILSNRVKVLKENNKKDESNTVCW